MFAPGERGDEAVETDEELRAMRAIDCTADMQTGAFADAYERIVGACEGTLTFFRIP